jgi:hypothetical protein
LIIECRFKRFSGLFALVGQPIIQYRY